MWTTNGMERPTYKEKSNIRALSLVLPLMAPPIDVTISFQDVVLPCLPTPASVLYLDNLDQQMVMNVEVVFFYRGCPRVKNMSHFHRSLAKLLVSYHFAAGRYQINEQERRIEVVCNRAGALFAAASSKMSLADLGDISLPNSDFRKLIFYPPKVESIAQIPLMTLQVTEFACGGYVLGFSTSHCLFDGVELNNLYRNFSKIVQGDDEDLHLTLKPILDKSHLNPATFSLSEMENYVHSELFSLPDIPAKVLFNPADYSLAGSPVNSPGYFYKLFRFTPTMLASLKSKAISDTTGLVTSCSTFEALAAHIWQCRTKIMHRDEDHNSPSKLFLSMDTRRTLESTLPAGFAGDSVILAPCTETTNQEVCENSLAFCVKKVQESLRSVTESFIKSQVRWCQGKHGLTNIPGGLLISTWSKLGLDTIDFGSGKPLYVTPLTSGRTELALVLANCLGDGGLHVLMAIEFEKMVEFERALLSV